MLICFPLDSLYDILFTNICNEPLALTCALLLLAKCLGKKQLW